MITYDDVSIGVKEIVRLATANNLVDVDIHTTIIRPVSSCVSQRKKGELSETHQLLVLYVSDDRCGSEYKYLYHLQGDNETKTICFGCSNDVVCIVCRVLDKGEINRCQLRTKVPKASGAGVDGRSFTRPALEPVSVLAGDFIESPV